MDLFEEALRFALEAHAGQRRKGENLPYILHPMEAAVICASLTDDPEILAAAVLHDTLEDTDTAPAELEARFGPRVLALVLSETEEKRPELPPGETWLLRKEETLTKLEAAEDPGVRILWMGDKLSNIRAFHRAWLREGDAVWQKFNQRDPERHAWYYRRILRDLSALKQTPSWQELKEKVDLIFGGTALCNSSTKATS